MILTAGIRNIPPFWKHPFDSDVASKLRELSQGRCAFCERSTGETSPYRFRPPAFAKPDIRPLGKANYLWLTFSWSNLYPICASCTPRQPHFFPVENNRRAIMGRASLDGGTRIAEKPVLYHPGGVVYLSRFAKAKTDGRFEAQNSRAAETIRHFNLNNEKLVQERAMLVREIELFFSSSKAFSNRVLSGELESFQYLLIRRLLDQLPPSSTRFDFKHFGRNNWRRRVERFKALPASPDWIASAFRSLRESDRQLSPAEKEPDEEKQHPDVQAGPPISKSRLRQVTINNFKSLEELAFGLPEKLAEREMSRHDNLFEDRAPCLMILGENATGKSSILQAIALALTPDKHHSTLAIASSELVFNPAYMGAKGKPMSKTAEVSVDFYDGYKYGFKIDPTGQAALSSRPKSSQGVLVFAYGSHRSFGTRTYRGPLQHIQSLFDDSYQLRNPEEWLRGLTERQLDEVVSSLRHIIQIDGDFDSIFFETSHEAREPSCMIRVRKSAGSSESDLAPVTIDQPLRQVSSGYKAILSMVCDIYRGLFEAMPSERDPRRIRKTQAIVLIDEVEAHLHPRWKLKIMSGLRHAFPNTTFIVTSHDPLCVRGMANGEVMALYRSSNRAGLPERVERVAGFENIEAMSIDQLLTSDLFQLYTTENAETERILALAADAFSKKSKGLRLSSEEIEAISYLNRKIANAVPGTVSSGAMPVGEDAITILVQEAVAEFLVKRRGSDRATVEHSRDQAKRQIVDFLESLVS